MFPIGSAGDAARYHDKSFNNDGIGTADNYYLNERAAAHWEGAGAELLGIADKPVTREAFIDALEGRLENPATGDLQDLGAWAAGKRRAGFDLTVAPPKSVSVAALVGGDARVVEAHQAANTRAMAWLEKHAAVVRVYENGGPVPKQKGNLLYATVLHETDRAHQPQLHSHNVVAAVVFDKESGKWRSLTNDTVLTLRTQADGVYKAELAKGLRAAGYELEYGKNGVDFEIKGFDPGHVAAFSVRTAQIDQALKDRGFDPASAGYSARQMATLATRAPKLELHRDVMHELWQEAARELGLDVRAIVEQARDRAATLQAEPALEQSPHGDRAALRAVAWSIEHLAAREQTFKVTDIVTSALKFDNGLGIDRVERAIDTYLADGRIVDRGLDGKAAAVVTTPGALEAERVLVQAIDAGRDRGQVVFEDPRTFDAAVAKFQARRSQETGRSFRLSGEQLTAARNLLMHRDNFQGIQGDAGTGKTAALAMVREAAEAQGWKVMGIATSSSAAQELQTSSGIPSQTVAMMLVDRDKQIKRTSARIAELRTQLDARGGTPAVVERIQLQVAAGGSAFDKGTYLFDHRKGQVLKSGTSLVNLVGNFLLDSADQGRAALAKEPGAADSGVSARVRTGLLAAKVGLADAVGRHLADYQRVGLVEKTLAQAERLATRDAVAKPVQVEFDRKVAELENLQRTGSADGRRTLLVMDEASLTGASDTKEIVKVANAIGARVVFQGDIKQHGSVAAGRAFDQAQRAGMHTSTLTETRRFDNASLQLRDALALFKAQDYSAGLKKLDTFEVKPGDLAAGVAQRYMKNHAELVEKGVREPSIGIVTLTNRDRKEINVAVREALIRTWQVSSDGYKKLHLDDPKLTEAQQTHVSFLRSEGVDRIVFRQPYREIGVKANEILAVERFDVARNVIVARNGRGKLIEVDPMKQERFSPARLEERVFAAGDQVEARANLRFAEKGVARVTNGARGVVQRIDQDKAAVLWHDGRLTELTNAHLLYVDHAYAHTSYKEQGQTTDRQLLAVSQTGANVINRESAYVAGTRARDNVEVITEDRERMLANANRDVSKSTAHELLLPLNRPSEERAVTMLEVVAILRGEELPAGVEHKRDQPVEMKASRLSAKDLVLNSERPREEHMTIAEVIAKFPRETGQENANALLEALKKVDKSLDQGLGL